MFIYLFILGLRIAFTLQLNKNNQEKLTKKYEPFDIQLKKNAWNENVRDEKTHQNYLLRYGSRA